jgi:hypothetical protein
MPAGDGRGGPTGRPSPGAGGEDNGRCYQPSGAQRRAKEDRQMDTPDGDRDPAADKRREARLRRMAAGMGLAIRKSRSRDRACMDYGCYRIVNPERNYVVTGGFPYGYSLDLDAVEDVLNELEAEKEQKAIKKQWEAVHGTRAAGDTVWER